MENPLLLAPATPFMRNLPLELIFQCYRLLFPPSFFDQGLILEKPAWKDLEGLTLASKASRDIALSLWFHIFRISDTADWTIVLREWTRLYRWTRAIHYTRTVYKTPRYLLAAFTRLSTLRIDLPPTHVTLDGDFDFAAPELAQIIHEGVPPMLWHLEVCGITWLDPFVMRHFAEGVPGLRTLRLRQPLVWCGLCNTVGAPAFRAVPGRVVYEDGTGLPDGYARYLASLLHLHTVVITLACGDGPIAYESLFSRIASNAPKPPGRKTLGWMGECESCMLQLLSDDTFRETWLAKQLQTTSPSALTGSSDKLIPPLKRPPSLRRVEWDMLELSHENWPSLVPMINVVHDGLGLPGASQS